MAINMYLSIITLNVNGLNAPIRRQWQIRLKKRTYSMLPTRDSPQAKNTHRLKVKGWKNIFHANENDKKTGIAILVSDKQSRLLTCLFKLKYR